MNDDASTENPWRKLRRHVREMDAALASDSVSWLAVAKIFDASARAMLAAMKAEGQSSMRFDAVVKALDLKTPKSKLQAFLST